jgi:hypothetical protein
LKLLLIALKIIGFNGSKKYGFNGLVYMVMVANGGVSVDDGGSSSSSNMIMVF